MADDVVINKAASIERAVRRVREEHAGDDANLFANQTRQRLNLDIVCSIVHERLDDFLAFTTLLRRR